MTHTPTQIAEACKQAAHLVDLIHDDAIATSSDVPPPENATALRAAAEMVQNVEALREAALFLADVAEANTDDTQKWDASIARVRNCVSTLPAPPEGK